VGQCIDVNYNEGLKMELDITWNRAAKVWLAYFWRHLIAIICSVPIGFVLGGIIGLILGRLGVSADTIKIVAGPLGFVIFILASIIPAKLILGKNFGEFRLVLVMNSPEPPHT